MSRVLVLVVSLAAPSIAAAVDCGALPAADLTICEELDTGSSGTAIGGVFDGQGYVVSDWGAHLHWDLPTPIASGEANWEVDDLAWETFIGDNCLLFQLYDTGGHWGSTYGVEVRGYGPDSGGYQGNLKLKFWSPTVHDECLIQDPGWDGGPHSFTVQWGDWARLYRDGALLCEMWMAGADYAFSQMDLPSQEWVAGYTGPVGARIRDLTVVAWEAPAAVDDPTLIDGMEGDFAVVADAAVARYLPGAVFSDVTDLACSANGGLPDEVSFVRFDVSAIGAASVDSATLQLTASAGPSSGGDSVGVHAVASDSWSESTLAWGAHPTWAAVALDATGPTAVGGTYALDVTAAVDAAVAAGDWLVSFALVGGEDGTHFDSKEAAGAAGPRLLVSWSPATGDDDTGDDDTGDDDTGDDDTGDDDTAGDDDTGDDDTGDDDTGDDDAGDDDTGDDDAGDDDTAGDDDAGDDDSSGLDLPGAPTPGGSGFGCSCDQSIGAAWLGLAVLAPRRRRSRPNP